MTRTEWRKTWSEYRRHWYEVERHFSPGNPDITPPVLTPEARRLVEAVTAPTHTVGAIARELVYKRRPDLCIPF